MNINEIDKANNLFIKIIPPEKFQNELEMSAAAYELSKETKLFKVAAIKNHDISQRKITYEFIPEQISFRKYYNAKARFGFSKKDYIETEKQFNKIGKSLFAIHSNSSFFEPVPKRKFPSSFLSKSTINTDDYVYIHGDFTMNNVLISPQQNDQLYIIDWNVSPIFDFSANYAPRFWDLSFFISSLFFLSPGTFWAYKPRKKLALAFINGYLADSNIEKKNFIFNLSTFLKNYNYYILYQKHYEQSANLYQKFIIKHSAKGLSQFAEKLKIIDMTTK